MNQSLYNRLTLSMLLTNAIKQRPGDFEDGIAFKLCESNWRPTADLRIIRRLVTGRLDKFPK